MTLHPDEQAREWQQTDIRHWFAANEKCPNCGIVLREMHPLVNLYPHWTGECRERAAAPSLHKEGLGSDSIRVGQTAEDYFEGEVPAALHKEGAGGALPELTAEQKALCKCGHSAYSHDCGPVMAFCCVCPCTRFDYAASPAGRAGQVSGATSPAKDGDAT